MTFKVKFLPDFTNKVSAKQTFITLKNIKNTKKYLDLILNQKPSHDIFQSSRNDSQSERVTSSQRIYSNQAEFTKSDILNFGMIV